jgi:hypothetical protein
MNLRPQIPVPCDAEQVASFLDLPIEFFDTNGRPELYAHLLPFAAESIGALLVPPR